MTVKTIRPHEALYKLVEKWNKRAEELISENLDSLIFKCI